MSETLWGLYWGLVLNLAVAAIGQNTFFDLSTQDWLVTLGAANEILGVLLVASPELLPRIQTVGTFIARYFRAWLRQFGRFLWRLLGLPGRTYIDAATATATATGSAEERILHGPPPGATREQLLDWLIKEYKALEDRVHELEKEVRGLPKRWRDEIAKTRKELERSAGELVRSTADRNLRLRLLGLLYVIVGIFLAWLGNVV
jgi:hypothetical protein